MRCPRDVLFRAQVCMWRNYRLIYIISFHSELTLTSCNIKFITLEIPACFHSSWKDKSLAKADALLRV